VDFGQQGPAIVVLQQFLQALDLPGRADRGRIDVLFRRSM
jgi:hypothetical protein